MPKVEARELSQPLTVLVSLPEDRGSNPALHGGLQPSLKASSNSLLASTGIEHKFCTGLHVGKILIPIKIKQFLKYFLILKIFFAVLSVLQYKKT